MRCVVIVLDSLGVGELPDAASYGDVGSNTLKSAVLLGKAKLPNMSAMGLFNIDGVDYEKGVSSPCAAYGRLIERSPGKDTTTGHWELMGKILSAPFPTFKKFPPEIVARLEKAFGRKILGNKAASGTVIIEELGRQHMRSGSPIVYTSADSVLQIAAHEEIITLEELYKMCREAREIMSGEYAVGRIIARPFTGVPGNFIRTKNRHDFSLNPGRTVLNILSENALKVIGVGKIGDIFAQCGITDNYPDKGNPACIERTFKLLDNSFSGLLFVNLVDFDSLYGHRNDPEGYARALEEFDCALPAILDRLKDEDILIITGDHGCDPATASTDHSREYTPLLLWGKKIRSENKHTRNFSDVAASIAHFFGIQYDLNGQSFL